MKLKIFFSAFFVLVLSSNHSLFAQNSATSPDNAPPSIPKNWLLLGNTGTVPFTNFLGTIDAQPLVFKVNNQVAGYLDYDATKANISFGYRGLISSTGYYNSALGFEALLSNTTGAANSATGFHALLSNTTGFDNTATGAVSMHNNTTGGYNTASGYQSLYYNTTGLYNTASGANALLSNTTANDNTGVGYNAGLNNTGYGSVFLGSQAGINNTSGIANVFIGFQAGYLNKTGYDNVCIGFASGISDGVQNATAIGAYSSASQSNTLILGSSQNVGIGTMSPTSKLEVQTFNANWGVLHTNGTVTVGTYVGSNGGWLATQSNSPLYFCTGLLNLNGSAQMTILTNGNVGIGTINPTYKLSVSGTMQAKEVRVETGWSDFVFDKDYKLRSLDNVEQYIQQNKHLPDIPSAAEIQKNGLAVGDAQTKMMQKIEELTLYVIELQKEVDQLKSGQNESK